ncbi:MAG: 30S ribosomal protein S8 [Ardenticatenaceae bacterium]
MTLSDPIADMLTRIRNALQMKHAYLTMPASNIKKSMADILVEEGYLSGATIINDKHATLRIELAYDDAGSVITNLKRVSKPGRRIYRKKDEIPWVLSGVGIAILSTSRGIVTDRKARRLGVGGEVLCYVW